MSKNKQKKSHARLIVLILTIIMLAGAAGCVYYSRYLTQQGEQILAQRQTEVEAINQQRQNEYYLALSEFNQQNAGSSANLAWPAANANGWDVVTLDNFPLESPRTQTVSRADAMSAGMLLVNEWHSRPDDFEQIEPQIVGIISHTHVENSPLKIAAQDNTMKAFPVAIDALQECLLAAKAQGFENYIIRGSYRTWDNQNERFQKEMEKYKNEYSGDELIAKAKKSVNYPGTSEYNSGLTMDIRLYKSNDAAVAAKNKVFYESDEGLWLVNNAWRYGFTFRFPLADYPVKNTADKSYKTGVSVKLDAWRYVGKGNAAVMHALDLCLEEYIEYLMEHPHIAVFENGVLKYEITREYVGDAPDFQVSVSGARGVQSVSTSLDNMGYAITVMEY